MVLLAWMRRWMGRCKEKISAFWEEREIEGRNEYQSRGTHCIEREGDGNNEHPASLPA